MIKKTKKAVEEARKRRPCKPGEKPKVYFQNLVSPYSKSLPSIIPLPHRQIRKKTAWFGIPSLPSRPELKLTSPLVLAVRLGRADCVEVCLCMMM